MWIVYRVLAVASFLGVAIGLVVGLSILFGMGQASWGWGVGALALAWFFYLIGDPLDHRSQQLKGR